MELKREACTLCVRKTSSGEQTAVARMGGRKLRDSPGVQAGGGEPGRGRAVGQEVLFRTDSKVPGAEVAAWSEQGGRAVRDSFWKKIALVKKSIHMETSQSVISLELALRAKVDMSIPDLAALG